MQPTPSGVHVDYALSNISLAYMQSLDGFVSDKVFPNISVDHQTNKYFTYTKNDWFRDEAKKRAPLAESAGSGYNLSTDSYTCDVFAIHHDIPDQVVANADAAVNPEAEAAKFVAQRMAIRMERQWASDYFTTSVWGTDKVGTTDFVKWDVAATSNPLVDLKAGRRQILATTGLKPNTFVAGWDVHEALKLHPDIIDRIKYVSDESITAQIIARYFEVDNYYVASAVYATNVEGETAAYDFALGKNALLCYVAPSPGLMTASAGYRFVWTGVSDGYGLTAGTVRIPLPKQRAVRVESQMAWDNKVVATDLGYFFSAAVS